eukprot:14446655-Alexandrium_andersonii.AAC.1
MTARFSRTSWSVSVRIVCSSCGLNSQMRCAGRLSGGTASSVLSFLFLFSLSARATLFFSALAHSKRAPKSSCAEQRDQASPRSALQAANAQARAQQAPTPMAHV